MKTCIRALFCAMVLLGLTTPAFATGILNDSEAPGSVLVFPKFIRGTVVTADQGTLPATLIEISVTCPKGALCADFQTVRLRAHWVCQGFSTAPCVENDFNLFTTVKGTLYFNPENVFPFSAFVPPPNCGLGYLIVWVIDALGRPIKFDGLIGDAVIRHSDQSAGAYNAIPIQAATGLANGAPTDVNLNAALDFDGTEYQAITGKIYGSIKYDRPSAVGSFAPTIETHLTLLTLDVLSNRPNYPTFVDLNFYSPFEELRSTSLQFTCWTETPIRLITQGLDESFGFKGLVESDPAVKVPIFGISDRAGPVTLIGVVETLERAVPFGPSIREYSYSLNNDGTPVRTSFVP
jgi:hypothetical protein